MPKTQAKVKIVRMGQGDCILVTSPSGKLVLVDAGSLRGVGPDYGYTTDDILYQLWGRTRRPAREIEAVVMTHHDADHYNLLGVMLQGAPIKNMYFSGLLKYYKANQFRSWCHGLKCQQVVYTQRLLRNPAEGVTVNSPLHEPIELISERTDNRQIFSLNIIASNCVKKDSNWGVGTEGPIPINTRSIVIQGTLAGNSFLLCGDATEYTEAYLHSQYGEGLKSTVVKVAHHGGGDSSTQTFVNDASPNEAVFSCYVEGTNYRHPRKEIVDRWSQKVDAGVARHPIRYWEYTGAGLEISNQQTRQAVWVTDDNGSFNYTFTQDGEFLRDEYN